MTKKKCSSLRAKRSNPVQKNEKNMKKINYKILLFIGGIGEERNISLKSGENILKTLRVMEIFLVEIDLNQN
jgi:hypothetical protein